MEKTQREAVLRDLVKGTVHEKIMYRQKREKLLIAFDKYKTNVQYGIETEDEEQHAIIIRWYRMLIDLNDIEKASYAIDNVPARIKYYL